MNAEAKRYYKELGDHKGALERYFKALDICNKNKLTEEAASIHGNCAHLLLQAESYYQAYKHADSCIRLYPSYDKVDLPYTCTCTCTCSVHTCTRTLTLWVITIQSMVIVPTKASKQYSVYKALKSHKYNSYMYMYMYVTFTTPTLLYTCCCLLVQ